MKAGTPVQAFLERTPLTILTLLLSLGSLGAGGWIGCVGGKIRHPEFSSARFATSTNQHKSMELP